MLNINYQFQDKTLYQTAMTHSSYANEHRGNHLHHNERLEFLGDSVLGFVTADYLFTHYPELPEGDLTKLRAAVVCEGAGSARVRLDIVNAVSAYTGFGSDRIKVLGMERSD